MHRVFGAGQPSARYVKAKKALPALLSVLLGCAVPAAHWPALFEWFFQYSCGADKPVPSLTSSLWGLGPYGDTYCLPQHIPNIQINDPYLYSYPLERMLLFCPLKTYWLWKWWMGLPWHHRQWIQFHTPSVLLLFLVFHSDSHHSGRHPSADLWGGVSLYDCWPVDCRASVCFCGGKCRERDNELAEQGQRLLP